MRRAWLLLAAIACGPRPAGTPVQPQAAPQVQRLLPPPLIDLDVRGAPYLTAVALALQPAWHQFLEDCRLRLPADHALNEMTLTAMAELEIDARGRIIDVNLATSGNADFDRAAKQVVSDSSPLPPPPRELWSDDDHVHLVWTFARDRRQAGPATAHVVDVELPLRGVVDRLIAVQDLARAARRILRAKPSADRDVATRNLMVAALREGLDSSDGAVRRAAVDAIGRAGVDELVPAVHELLGATQDIDLRLAALELHGEASRTTKDALVGQLRIDIEDNARLAVAEARALVAMGEGGSVTRIVKQELAKGPSPSPSVLHVLSVAPLVELAPELAAWFRRGDARVRAGVCAALRGFAADTAWPILARGFADRDATVRATCLATAVAMPRASRDPVNQTAAKRAAVKRLRDLTKDRDSTVRARALIATGELDPGNLVDASADRAAEVRAAYADAVQRAMPADREARLRQLIDDRDPDVRAAAWTALAASTANRDLAPRAVLDSAAPVRRAALGLIDDDATLLRLAGNDDSADVRTAALVQLARVRPRSAIGDVLVERLANAGPGTGERVRAALAWLVAR